MPLLSAKYVIAVLTTGMMMALLAPRAEAQERLTQAFLNRFRPPNLTKAPEPLAGAEPAIQSMIRNGVLPLTSSDLVRLMLENNLDVRMDRLSPLLSRYAIDAALSRFEPALRLSAGINHSTAPTSSQLAGASTSSQLGLDYGIGYSQTLPTGTNIGVDFNVSRDSSNSVFSTFNPSYYARLTYSFTQPLLRNFGREATEHSIRVAKNSSAMPELQFEMQLISMVTSAELQYWDLVFDRENVRVMQRSLELAEKMLTDNQRQVQVGTLAPIEVVQAEAQVASRQEQMIVTSYRSDQLQDQIKRTITRVGNPALVLARLSPIETARKPNPDDVLPLEQAIRYALEHRPELRLSALELKGRDMDLRASKNNLLPALNLTGSYTQSGIGGTETLRSGLGDNQILGVRRGGVANALGQIFSYDFTGYAFGVTLSIPLGNTAARADYSRAFTEKELAETRRATLIQEITIDVRNANSQVEMNRARIHAAEKGLELATRQLAAEEKKNQIGVSAIRFVFDEQRNLADAQTNQIQALIDYAKALVQYDRAIGRTLERNHIEIQKEMRAAN